MQQGFLEDSHRTLTSSAAQAIDAKRAAAEEVERLLQHPEDLKRLSGLLEDYTQKHQAGSGQQCCSNQEQDILLEPTKDPISICCAVA